MRGSDLQRNFLAGKIAEVEKWVRIRCDVLILVYCQRLSTLSSAGATTDCHFMFYGLTLSLTIRWDEELMWDIRYLLMGSKLDKQPGFPTELYDVREKLYITRDGISERGRGPSLD